MGLCVCVCVLFLFFCFLFCFVLFFVFVLDTEYNLLKTNNYLYIHEVISLLPVNIEKRQAYSYLQIAVKLESSAENSLIERLLMLSFTRNTIICSNTTGVEKFMHSAVIKTRYYLDHCFCK